MDEVVAQLRGALQRLVALGQRPLDVHARGHVDEGEERRAVRQRLGGAVEHRAVAPLHAAGHARARLGQARHRAADLDPGLVGGASSRGTPG